MKAIAATLLALMFALVLVVPTGAAGKGADMVTKTFKLTLNGDIPVTQGFFMIYLEEGEDPETGGKFVIFCADEDQVTEEELLEDEPDAVVSDAACVGGGNTYTYTAEFKRGTRIIYFIGRQNLTDVEDGAVLATSADKVEDIFTGTIGPEDFETLDTHKTNAATCTMRGGTCAEEQIPSMPNTGAGGLAPGAGRPWLPAAALGLLAVAGLAATALRRWRIA